MSKLHRQIKELLYDEYHEMNLKSVGVKNVETAKISNRLNCSRRIKVLLNIFNDEVLKLLQ